MTDAIFDVETIPSVDGTPVVIVRGDLDTTSAARLDAAVGALQTDRPTSVVVDLAAVNFLGPTGVAMLVQLHERLHAAGVELTVHSPSRTALIVFHLTGTNERFNVRLP